MGDLGWGPRIRYLVFGLSRSSFGAEGYTGPDYARVEGHTGLDHAASRGTVGGAHTYTHIGKEELGARGKARKEIMKEPGVKSITSMAIHLMWKQRFKRQTGQDRHSDTLSCKGPSLSTAT